MEFRARERTPLPCSASLHLYQSLTPLKITALESSNEKEKGEGVEREGSPADQVGKDWIVRGFPLVFACLFAHDFLSFPLVDDQEAPFVVMCNVSSAAVQRTSISLQHVAVP